MGYYVDMEMNNMVISADKVQACLSAINEMFTDENLENGSGGSFGGSITEETPIRERKWYSWVNNPDGGFKTLQDALESWRYSYNLLENGDVEIEYFNGEKLGDDSQFMEVIAPFMPNGSSVDCRGEDGCLWQWMFKDGILDERSGKVVYE
jgi:hypothetical protein